MLQARIMSYADTHRYRLGVNYDTIAVNQPHATKANSPYRDGLMRVDGNNGSRINYSPTHHSYPEVDKNAQEPPYHFEGMADRISLEDEDYYDQARLFYQMLKNDEKERLVSNIAGSLGKCMKKIQDSQSEIFRNVSEELAEQVSKAIAKTEPPQPEPKPATV